MYRFKFLEVFGKILTVIILCGLIAASAWAEILTNPDNIDQQRLQSLIQRKKLLESQISTRQKNASQKNDPVSRQYHIGYKDGYNKAVLDLLKSQLLTGVPYGNTDVAATPVAIKPMLDEPVLLPTMPVIVPATQEVAKTPSTTIKVNPSVSSTSRKATEVIPQIKKQSVEMVSKMPVSILVKPPLIVPSITAPSAKAAAGAAGNTPAKSQQAPKTVMVNKPVTKVSMEQARKKQEQQFQKLIKRSIESLEAKNWPQAVSFSSAALAVKGDSVEAYIHRSWAFAEQSLFGKALEDANKAIKLGPKNALAYNNRAYTYDLKGDLPRAKVDYQYACSLGFSNACIIVKKIEEITHNQTSRLAALEAEGERKIAQRAWTELAVIATQIIALNPQLNFGYIKRAWANAEQGKFQDALQDANKAVALNSRDPLAYNIRAYTYDLMEDLPNARIDYQQACNLNYHNACGVVKKIDTFFAQQKLKKKAQMKVLKIKATDKKAPAKPKKVSKSTQINTLIKQSRAKFREGNWHAVVMLSNKVLRLDPRNAAAYVYRAGARTEMGLYYNAVDDTDLAIQINPRLGMAYNNKAYALERMGRINRAAKQYQQACKLGVKQSCSDFKRLTVSVSKSK